MTVLELPPLGDQELDLLSFVTDHGPITVREAVERYGKDRRLARTTVLTMLERLRAKGYLDRSEEGGVNGSSPRLSSSKLMHSVVRSFVETKLGGALSPFVAYLAEHVERISPDELEDLKRLLNEIDSQEGRKRRGSGEDSEGQGSRT